MDVLVSISESLVPEDFPSQYTSDLGMCQLSVRDASQNRSIVAAASDFHTVDHTSIDKQIIGVSDSY